MKMSWDYISGYFDGEGSAGFYNHTWGISFHNTHLASLQSIMVFLKCGHINKRHGTNKPMYAFVVRRIADLKRIIPHLARRCIIKKQVLTHLYEGIKSKKGSPHYGFVADCGAEEIRRLYWDEKLSTMAIGKKIGVHASAVINFMERNGIPRRTKNEAMRQTYASDRWKSRFWKLPLARVGPDEIRRLYWEDGLSIKGIGKKLHANFRSVASYMLRHNIPTRTHADSIRNAVERGRFIGRHKTSRRQ